MFERLLSRRTLLALSILGTIYFLTTITDSREYINSHLPHQPPPQQELEDDSLFRQQLSLVRPTDKQPHSKTLGIADAIFVISLARRTDRRQIMDSIATALDLEFTYIDATDYKSPSGRSIINRIRDRVRWQRPRIDNRPALPSEIPTPDFQKSETYIWNAFPFKWSEDVEKNKDDPFREPLGVYGADYWDLDPVDEEWERENPLPDWTKEEHEAKVMEASVTNNQNRQRWITDAGFSCWHSHHRTVREIVRRSESLSSDKK